MNEVKKSDIELIINALKEHFDQVTKTGNFNLQEFVNFMEPKFTEAGYRNIKKVGEEDRQNILLIAGDGLGDFILMSPAIREIRRIYPEAYITLIINNNHLPFAAICPYVNDLIVRPKQGGLYFGLTFKEDLTILPQILEHRFDVAFSFKSFADFSLLMYMSGAQSRITHYISIKDFLDLEAVPSGYFSHLATNIAPFNKYGPHSVDCFLSVVDDTLHVPVSNRELEIWYTPADVSSTKTIINNISHPFYALTMGATDPRRRYPPEKYAELIKLILSEEPTAMFVNLGGGQIDLNLNDILKQNLGEKIFSEHVIDLVNKINFRQSAFVLSSCDMYIGNYTGTMHAAAAVKCPILAPNCFPKDLHSGKFEDVKNYSPYRVPSVVVQPAQALGACKEAPYHFMGCKSNTPHCITQIAPETLLRGFHLLKEQIAKKATTPLYIS